MPESVVIFAIRQGDQSLLVEPVVVVHYGSDQRFKTIPSLNSPLPSGDATNAEIARRQDLLYPPNTRMSLFSGGEKLGIAEVKGSRAEWSANTCVDLSAPISYHGSRVPLLATSTTSEIPSHASTRRSAGPEEISIFRELVVQWLEEYGLDRQLLQQGQVIDAVSTELRKDAGLALIGRYDVRSERSIHRLFAVAEKVMGEYQLTLTNLEIQRDLEDETDKAVRDYIDQLDINNDGLDELITRVTHYESWRYTIWRFDGTHRNWSQAYKGGGGGC